MPHLNGWRGIQFLVLSEEHNSLSPAPASVFRIQPLKHETSEQARSVSQSVLQSDQEQVESSVQSVKEGDGVTNDGSEAALQNSCGKFQQIL